jgi:hypothetical protein
MQLTQLIAGDSLSILTSVADRPATDGWTLKLRMVPRGAGSVIALTAAAEGASYRFTAAAASTASYAAGNYTWATWVERGAESYSVESGQLVIAPDPRTAAAGYDGRSLAQRTLDDLRAAFATFSATGGTTRRYRIGDREREFNSAADILTLLRYWEQQVEAEDVLAGRKEQLGRRIHTRI